MSFFKQNLFNDCNNDMNGSNGSKSNDTEIKSNNEAEAFSLSYLKHHRYSLDLPGIVQSKLGAGPQPQLGDAGPKLVVVMVGLPARGKSYITKKLKRYLTWLQYETKVFNVGNLRRHSSINNNNPPGSTSHSFSFFDPHNEQAKQLREHIAMECLDELIDWLKKGGRIGIHDATNSTITRRKLIMKRIQRESSFKILFIESICTDKKVLEKNMALKLSGPDYKNMDPEEALNDFRKRITNYEKAYETIDEQEELENIQYCKLINVGKKVIAHNIQGFLSGQCIFYLMNLNLVDRQIWITRHGESTDNILGRIGGDSSGVCEEMTYQQIEEIYPEEYSIRKSNKLYYRYPGMGESYLDVIHRINPLIIELERMTDNILIVTHRVVLRIVLAYFSDVEKEKIPHMDVPLHTVYCLQPKAYGTELLKWVWDENEDLFFQG
ncbi:11365_t:CDS:10 [Diversispora eburnea]|uniref:11365_t:CDS:1 n=1 Tax=Diversispora eburnea TaxID=1213867 RepID=A0A9N8YMK3_9GLOM|nr:11365_t:CDS:10 [Diversispora eburnea]